MNIRYRVELNEGERAQLTAMLSAGRHAVRKLRRAHIVVAADAGISDAASESGRQVAGSTVYRASERSGEGRPGRAHVEAREPPPGRMARCSERGKGDAEFLTRINTD